MNELQQNLTIVMEEILGAISSSPITQGLYDELLGTEGLPKVEAPEPTFESKPMFSVSTSELKKYVDRKLKPIYAKGFNLELTQLTDPNDKVQLYLEDPNGTILDIGEDANDYLYAMFEPKNEKEVEVNYTPPDPFSLTVGDLGHIIDLAVALVNEQMVSSEEDDVWETVYEPQTMVYSGETNKLTEKSKKALIKYLNEAIANNPSIPSGKISIFPLTNIVALSEMSEYPNIMICVEHDILMDNNIAYAIDVTAPYGQFVVEKLPIIEGTGQLTAKDILTGFHIIAVMLKTDFPQSIPSLKFGEKSQLPPRTATKPLIRSPYTLVFDKPYHSNPPPLSPLADAYYGSKAYYDKGSDKEISIHVLNVEVAKPPKCPQISGGSAKKWVVANPYNATCILVKQYPKKSQPRVETFVAQVHRALGMPAPDMRFHQTHLLSPLVSDAFQPLTSTKMKSIVKQQYSTMSVDITNNAFRNAVDLLIVSTWLVNWDVLGISGDNSLIDDKGNIQCIDLGGALMFRATGGWKGEFEKWNADWGADYQTIKTNMIKALMQMQSIGTNKQFQGLLNHSIGKKEAELITEKMMMLFHPQYNYIEKLIVWTNMPAEVYVDGYNFEAKINPLDTKDLNKIFVTWLQARALALYEIVRGI